MTTQQDFIELNKNNGLMICQNCFNEFPLIKIYFDINGPQLEIKCKCSNKVKKISIEKFITTYDLENKLLRNPCSRNMKHNDKITVSYCRDCQQTLCKQCYDEHNKIYQNYHSIVTADTEPIVHCKTHIKQKNNKFCKTCQIELCQLCLDAHNNHDTVNLNIAKEKINIEALISKKNEILNKHLNSNENMFQHFIHEINNNKELLLFKSMIIKSFNFNNKANLLINHFIDILLDNYQKVSSLVIYNLISSIVNNTDFNDNIFQNKPNTTILNQLSSFNLYLHNNFILRTRYIQSKYHCSYEGSEHVLSIDVMIQLQDGRLVSGSEDKTFKFCLILSTIYT